jgi:hypothetical protein
VTQTSLKVETVSLGFVRLLVFDDGGDLVGILLTWILMWATYYSWITSIAKRDRRFSFSFLVRRGFELRAWPLRSRCSTA